MVFSSTVFLFLFLPLVLVLYYLPCFRGRTARNAILLIASLGFYAWGEPLFVFVMLFSILVNYAAGLGIARGRHARLIRVLAVVWNLGLLFAFKYLSFAARTAGLLLGRESALSIALPVGISFFTFQILSYVLDVAAGRTAAQRNLPDLALYISLFPQLIAGPIVRYTDIQAEIRGRTETGPDFTAGVFRFAVGLSKKVLLANYLALIADNAFAAGTLSAGAAWLGAVAYMLQIYFDFSGYSDMAIGLGLLFGFHFMENFRYPYAAASVTDFWRRWHISLSSWFRDYVYIPMGGSRVSRGRWVRNLFVVWLLTGIWHGANWTFLVWGLYYFLLLLMERLTELPRRLGAWWRAATLLLVLFGWVLFRADSLPAAGAYLAAMFGAGGTDGGALFRYLIGSGLPVLAVSAVAALPLAPRVRGWAASRSAAVQQGLRTLRAVALGGLFLLSVLVAVKATYNPFIYFNF